MTIILITVYIGIILYEVPKLFRNKYWKELAVISFFISLAFFISLMSIWGIEIPTPVKDVQYYVRDFFKSFLQLSYD